LDDKDGQNDKNGDKGLDESNGDSDKNRNGD
jgi:hypothetical protein